MKDDRWLSVQDIAAHLGVQQETIYVWIAKKAMPAHKVGRLWKFKKEQVDQWIISGDAKPEPIAESGKPSKRRKKS